MRIGLIGAQGTGKTTLAKAFSARWKTPFVETSLSNLFKVRGLEVRSEMDFDTRLDIQRDMLDYLVEQLENNPEMIADRTPIDIAAYSIAIAPYGATPEQCERLEQHVFECLEAAEQLFDSLVLIQPGIELTEEDIRRTDRGLINFVAQERITSSSYYLLSKVGVSKEGKSVRCGVIPLFLTELEDRLRVLDKFTTGVTHKACYVSAESKTLH